MPFAMFCQHKGCKGTVDQMEPYLDPKADKVYCNTCDKELNVTYFMKVQMKSMKQFRQKQPVAFGVKCQKCGKEAQPILVNNNIVCPSCGDNHSHLSEHFKIMLKSKLKSNDQDD